MSFTVHTARRPLLRKPTRAGFAALGPDQFEGYASLFNVRDGAGDSVAPGAFAASLRQRGPDQVRMLYQHFSHAPIGVWEEIAADSIGLYVRGRLSSDVEQARDVRALLRDGALNGLSIGFRTRRAKRGPGNTRTLLEIDLGALCGCSTPPPAAPTLMLSAPVSPPASLMTPPRTLSCLRLRPCSPAISVPPGRMPAS